MRTFEQEPQIEPAGVAHRFVAVLIDGVVLLFLAFLLAILTGGTYSTAANGAHTWGFKLSGGGAVVWALLAFAYYVVLETLSGGTLGKMAVGLRVVDKYGDPIGWGAAVIRNLLRLVDGLFFYLVAAVAVWSSSARQRLGDRAAHTYVVRPLH
jgi:uncharacterized RDD family membrane protein YckC